MPDIKACPSCGKGIPDNIDLCDECYEVSKNARYTEEENN